MTGPNPAAVLADVTGMPDVLTPADIASLFRVDPKTVTRWAKAGRLPSFRTPGGHRRFRRDDILPLLRGEAAR